MRKLISAVGIVLLACFASDALACARCSTSPDNCDVCYEAQGDGGNDCYLTQGEYCTIVGPGQCEGVDDGCQTVVCPEDKWTSGEETGPERDWQLVSFEVIRPGSVTRSVIRI